MKRKRFIKLCMSYGMSRNNAQKACADVPLKYGVWIPDDKEYR